MKKKNIHRGLSLSYFLIFFFKWSILKLQTSLQSIKKFLKKRKKSTRRNLSTFNKSWIKKKRNSRRTTPTFKGILVSWSRAGLCCSDGWGPFESPALHSSYLCSLICHTPSTCWKWFLSQSSISKGLGDWCFYPEECHLEKRAVGSAGWWTNREPRTAGSPHAPLCPLRRRQRSCWRSGWDLLAKWNCPGGLLSFLVAHTYLSWYKASTWKLSILGRVMWSEYLLLLLR